MRTNYLRSMLTRLSVFVLLGQLSLIAFTGQNCAQEPGTTTSVKGHADPGKLVSGLETAIPQLMDKAKIPGLSVALIKDAKILWNGSFGVKRLETQEAVNDSTIFQAASLSKAVFAYAVLKMVESGKLDLDTPLSNYLPDYVDDERIEQITARIVLSHTTGFPNWRPRDGDLKIHFTPGSKFSYSGEGYVYLQKVIEHITDLTLNEFMQQTVFDPLGMRNSSYVWQERFKPNYAVGHSEFGRVVERDPMTEGNAAASLYTTAIDYAKFVVAILNDTGLEEQTIRQMLTPQIQLNEDCVNCIQTQTSNLSNTNAWGLGWGLQTSDEGLSFWHWGDQGIFRCYVVAFNEEKMGLVYFTNSENGLSIRDELVTQAIGGEHPAFAWLDYNQYDAPIKKFTRTVVNDGLDAGMQLYAKLKQGGNVSPVYPERAINRFGYQLLRMDRIEDAIAVFKLNVDAYPDSWNVYDSLAEAYMENGQNDLAIQFYKKSLQINPDNTNGKRMLEKLGVKTAAAEN